MLHHLINFGQHLNPTCWRLRVDLDLVPAPDLFRQELQ